VEVRRVGCRSCGKVKRERLDWLADNPFYTKRFAWFVGRRCRASTIKDVAKELHLDWHTVKEIEKQYMREQFRRQGAPRPKVVGIDEVSIKKGQISRDGEPRTWLDASSVARIAVGNWPGNVRRLRNVATHLAVSSRGRDRAHIDPILAQLLEGKDVLSSEGPGQDTTPQAALAPHEISPDNLMETLRAHRWSPGAAAAALGISRTTLYQLIEKHPQIRTANSIPEKEILRCHEETKGDLALMSERLRVSPRGLQHRLRQLLR
jgi:DNA-binding XRE family transcriptional regulator